MFTRVIAGAVLVALSLLNAAADAATAARPNIVFIVADDLGYGDIGANGGTLVATPDIDRLAAEGIRFTDGHVTGAVCSPSRAGLMTGRNQARFGHDVNPVQARPGQGGLLQSEVTIAERMRAAGYRTGLFGKWHLGVGPGFLPPDRGFDEFFGFAASAKFLSPRAEGDGALAIGAAGRSDAPRRLIRGREVIEEEGYLTDLVTREALAFIDRHRAGPFFMIVTHYNNHVPIEAPKRYMERVAGVADPDQRVYAAMTVALDDAVGAIMKKLEDSGIAEHTLVLFTSDNGCPDYLQGICTNGPLAGHKRDLREGGHRVPMIARWPAGGVAGAVSPVPVLSIDFAVTALHLAGADVASGPPLDGVDLSALLTDPAARPPDRLLFWRAGTNYVVRDGRWKLLVAERPDGTPATFLFDLANDIGESTNLAAAEPARVEALKAAFAAWNAGNAAPQWPARKIEVEVAGTPVLMSY